MPLRAMRIPQGVFGVRWGKNITHALSKKTRLIILRQKLKKLLAFQKEYFFWDTLYLAYKPNSGINIIFK